MVGGLSQPSVGSRFGQNINSKSEIQNWKLLLSALAFVFVSGSVQAESLPDPTLAPSGGLPLDGSQGQNSFSGPVLQSVLISSKQKSAIISGKTVMLGQKFSEATLVKISEGEVVLRQGENKQVLSLFPPSIEKKLVVESPKKAGTAKKR